MASYIEDFKSKLDWAMPFQRTGKFPLDRTDLFDSYADAVKYAAGNSADPDKRELCGSSYVGQIITVFENNLVTVYKISATRSLEQIGSTSVDNLSIWLNERSEVSIKGYDDATQGQMLVKDNVNGLAWVDPLSPAELDDAVRQAKAARDQAGNYATAAGTSAAQAETSAQQAQRINEQTMAWVNNKFWWGTIEEYNQLEEINEGTFYFVQL